MTKGGKRYANMEQDGNWFAHIGVERSGTKREACTSTGSMLAEGVLKSTLQGERYPEMKLQKNSAGRSYPFSEHDNRATLQDDITAYENGLGRKKCLDARHQHDSHFCLCHEGSMSAVEQGKRGHLAYQTNFVSGQGTETGESMRRRRFPRSHLEQSRQAVLAQDGEIYIWFGRNDLDHHIPFNVLAASNRSSYS